MTDAQLRMCVRAARAFTLTELAIVLGIIGAIIGAIWTAAGAAFESRRTDRAVQQIAQIVSGFQGMVGGRPSNLGRWTTDVTGLAINNGFMPADMLPPGYSCSGTASSAPATAWGLGPAAPHTFIPGRNTVLSRSFTKT